MKTLKYPKISSYKMPELTRIFWTAINLTENIVFEGGLAVAVVHHNDGSDVFPQGHAVLLITTGSFRFGGLGIHAGCCWAIVTV